MACVILHHTGCMSRTQIVFEPALYFRICCNLLHSFVVNEIFNAYTECFLFHVASYVCRGLYMIEHVRLNLHFFHDSYIVNRTGKHVKNGQYRHRFQSSLCTHNPPPWTTAPLPSHFRTKPTVP